jgi:cytochrome P450
LVAGDCTVPAGATIGVSFLSIHFDPEAFPDPEKFDPERFSPENMAKMKKYTYLPFSGGSRNCIGNFTLITLIFTNLKLVSHSYLG